MQTDQIGRNIGADMIFYSHIVVEPIGPLLREGPPPFDIQVAPFTIGGAGYFRGKNPVICVHRKHRPLELHIGHLD